MDTLDALKRCFYFSRLSQEQLEALAQISYVRHYESDETIFGDGEDAIAFYVVIEGQVQIYKASPEGKAIILHLFGPGEIFAEVPIFCGIKTYPANALCLKPTEVLAVNGQAFRRLAEKHPEILLRILSLFAKRLREFSELVEDLSLRSVDSRLAKYLLSVSEQSPDHVTIKVHKKTLAAILGTIPETLSRAFKKLSDENIIGLKGQQVRIINRPALKALANIDSD